MKMPITTASSPACVMSNMVLYLLAIMNGEMIHGHLLQANPILPEIFFLTRVEKVDLSFVSGCKNLELPGTLPIA